MLAVPMIAAPPSSALAGEGARGVAQSGSKREEAEDGSFALTFGKEWTVDRIDGYLVGQLKSRGVTLLGISFPSAGEAGFKPFVDGVLSGFNVEPDDESVTRSGLKPATFGPISDARREKIEVLRDDREITLQFNLFTRGARSFAFIAFGETAQFTRAEKQLSGVYATVETFDKVYGLERGKTVSLAGGRFTPENADPATGNGGADSYMGLMFSGLTRLTPQLQVEPDLAEGWKISSDGKTYTFTLRKSAAFADGKAITADDVRYSWERAASPKLASKTASTYLGDIDGYADFANGKAKTLRGLKVVDARTLQVTLDAAKPYFLSKITYPTAFIVDQRDVKRNAKTWMLKPNASGPFKLKQHDEDKVVIFERNPRYYQQPKIENVLYYVFPGGSPLSQYQAGTIDLTFVGDTDARQIQAPNHPNTKEIREVNSLCTSLINFDTRQAPMDDINMRRAMSLAIDWDALAEVTETPLDSAYWDILPPSLPAYRERERALSFDPATAKAALAKSKYAGKLPKLTLTSSGSATNENATTTALISQWRKTLGVEIEVEYYEFEDFVPEARKRHGQIVPFGWCADYPDPENFLDVLFHSNGGYNVAGISDKALDELLVAARTEPDAAKRLSLYEQAETRIYDEVMAIPWPRSTGFILVNPRLKNYTPTGMSIQQWHRVEIVSVKK
jgi:ABC-type transport system substrate-binding protein